MAAPPAAISVTKAMIKFISGNVMASPDMAIALTPCPMNMESIILYRDVTTLAMIAGTEYCISNRLTDAVPSVSGDESCVADCDFISACRSDYIQIREQALSYNFIHHDACRN